MAVPKVKHKHQYIRYLEKRLYRDRTMCCLKLRCTICGKIKDPPFRESIFHFKDGTIAFITSEEGFKKKFGELPVVDMTQCDNR